MAATLERTSPPAMDAEELNLLLGLYLSKIDDTPIQDAGDNTFPADSVIYQLIKKEITELAETRPVADYWECVFAETSLFTIRALTIAMNETPRNAKAQLVEELGKLRGDLAQTIKWARGSQARSA